MYKCLGIDKLILKLILADTEKPISNTLQNMFSGVDTEFTASDFKKFVDQCLVTDIDQFNTYSFLLIKSDIDKSLSKTYRNVYTIHHKSNNTIVGRLAFNAYNKALFSNLIYLDIDNQLLYDRSLLVNILQLLFDELNLILNNIAKIDIFNDTENQIIKTLNKYFTKFDKYYFKKWNKKGFEKQDISTVFRNDTSITETGNGIYFTDKQYFNKRDEKDKSTVICRIYDKSLEMIKNPKQYIKEYHKKHNLNNNIYRMEYSITNNCLYKLNLSINLNQLDNDIYLSEIFDLFYDKFFDIRKKTNGQNVSRFKKIRNIFM